MKKFSKSLKGLAISLLLWLSWCSQAHAADTDPHLDIGQLKLDVPCAPQVMWPRRAAVQHEGVDGFWFQRDVGICMLERVALVPKLAQRVDLLQDKLDKTENLLTLNERVLKVSDEVAGRAEDSLMTAVKLKREAEEDRDSLFAGKPIVWIGVGVGVTIILEVVVVLVIGAVKDG